MRLIFEKAEREGLGPLRIAKYLNKHGYTTRKGRPWNQSSISRILNNRLYLGFLKKGRAESPRLPELQIVSDDTFMRVQEIRKSRGNGESNDMITIPKQTGGKSLLSGFLYCAHCGARANGCTSRKQHLRKDGSLYQRDRRTYRCNASIDGIPVVCDGPRTYQAERLDEAFKTAVSDLLKQLEALPVETILEYKYQIALKERRQEYQQAQNTLGERQRDYMALRNEVAKALRGKSKFQLALLQSLLEETERHIEHDTTRLYELRTKLQNAEQIRREIEVKQLKYIGLNQIFTTGTMEEKKMLLSILISRVEVKRGYELNIRLSPGFEQFLEGLIEMR